MKKSSLIGLLILLFIISINNKGKAQQFNTAEVARWKQQASQVTIIRDEWDVPHIYGKTDADAVFGLMYAQCEENFEQIELNYLEMLGRSAEVNGEKAMVSFDVD